MELLAFLFTNMDEKVILNKLLVFIIKVIVIIIDVLLYTVHYFLDKPWKSPWVKNIVWAKLENPNDPYSCYVRQVKNDKISNGGPKTMDELFASAAEKYGEKPCYGVREVLGEVTENIRGKEVLKTKYGKYKWISYNQANERIVNVGKGMLRFGIQSRKHVALLAETRVEWILAAQALFKMNVPIVTLYATLGEEGLMHGLKETGVKYLITSKDMLKKLKSVLPHVPNVTHLICMDEITDIASDELPNNVTSKTLSQIEEDGKNAEDFTFIPTTPDDLAILMYTSGSTGVPKGVMITHKNLLNAVNGFEDVLNGTQLGHGDSYVAYLPLAHALELAAECFLTYLGVRVGFSTPQTLTDFSPGVIQGDEGDVKALKPTLMVAVPLMLDRIRKGILYLAGKENTFSRLMFDFAINYKVFWTERGFQTRLLDRYVLHTYRDFLGGNVRLLVSGSAPLSPDTQRFTRACLSVQVLQAYGLTESAACATAMDYEDISTGRVGAPLTTSKLRLIDWEEGNYFVTDTPNPRGEIILGGNSITMGYFKRDEETKDVFKDGWLYTGDIGEVFPDGTLKIIDRKKDLVKLQFGEYIALGKVEAELKTCPLVENICVYGSGLHTYLVALVVPSPPAIKALSQNLGKQSNSLKEMCSDISITTEFNKKLQEHARKCLIGSEIPKKIKLVADEWNPESGLVTAAFKLRRKIIQEHYRTLIYQMYKENVLNGS